MTQIRCKDYLIIAGCWLALAIFIGISVKHFSVFEIEEINEILIKNQLRRERCEKKLKYWGVSDVIVPLKN